MINSEPRLLLTRTNFVENAGLKFTSSPHQKLCGGPQPHRKNKYQARNRPAPQALSLFWPAPRAAGHRGPRGAVRPAQRYSRDTQPLSFVCSDWQILLLVVDQSSLWASYM
jgi:hypothetical protein